MALERPLQTFLIPKTVIRLLRCCAAGLWLSPRLLGFPKVPSLRLFLPLLSSLSVSPFLCCLFVGRSFVFVSVSLSLSLTLSPSLSNSLIFHPSRSLSLLLSYPPFLPPSLSYPPCLPISLPPLSLTPYPVKTTYTPNFDVYQSTQSSLTSTSALSSNFPYGDPNNPRFVPYRNGWATFSSGNSIAEEFQERERAYTTYSSVEGSSAMVILGCVYHSRRSASVLVL